MGPNSVQRNHSNWTLIVTISNRFRSQLGRPTLFRLAECRQCPENPQTIETVKIDLSQWPTLTWVTLSLDQCIGTLSHTLARATTDSRFARREKKTVFTSTACALSKSFAPGPTLRQSTCALGSLLMYGHRFGTQGGPNASVCTIYIKRFQNFVKLGVQTNIVSVNIF